MQYLVVIALIIFVYYFFIRKKPLFFKKQKEQEAKELSHDMVKCPTCGIYAEVDDSILSNGKYYCSKECLEKK